MVKSDPQALLSFPEFIKESPLHCPDPSEGSGDRHFGRPQSYTSRLKKESRARSSSAPSLSWLRPSSRGSNSRPKSRGQDTSKLNLRLAWFHFWWEAVLEQHLRFLMLPKTMRIFIISWSTSRHLEPYPESISRLKYLRLRHPISWSQVVSFCSSQVVSYLHKNCSCLVTLLSVKRTSESKALILRSNYLQYHPSTNHRPHIRRHCDHRTMIWSIATKHSLMHRNCQTWTLHLSFVHHVHCRLYIPQKLTIIAICLLNTGRNLWRHGCVTPIRNCTSMLFSAGDTGFGQRMVKLSLAAVISSSRNQRSIRIIFTRQVRTRWMPIYFLLHLYSSSLYIKPVPDAEEDRHWILYQWPVLHARCLVGYWFYGLL